MKIYLFYLLPKNTLYAFTTNKKYVEDFISQRNSKCFKVIKIKMNDETYTNFLNKNKKIMLEKIPLEDSNGDYEIIGTNDESTIIDYVCENISDTCAYFKSHFNENFSFNDEYKYILDQLTTISKNINCHQIIQIDSVKLFYYIFRETFTTQNYEDIEEDDTYYGILEKYKKMY